MKTKVYSLFDLKAAVYGTPFFSLNDATAVRSVTTWTADSHTPLFTNPEDYVLHRIGEFDDGLGVLSGEQISVVATVMSMVREKRVVPPENYLTNGQFELKEIM